MLMFTIKIEHALKEWENGKKAHKVAYAEDIAKHRWIFFYVYRLIFIDIYSSYAHHMGNWKRMANKAPAWVRFWKNDIMEKLL